MRRILVLAVISGCASPDSPMVAALAAPAHPEGVIPLAITLIDATSPTVDVSLDVRCAPSAPWRTASVLDSMTDLPASPDGVTTSLRWNSLADLDFHAPQSCELVAVAVNPDGDESEPLVVDLPAIDNLRAAAREVDHHLISYGPLDEGVVATAHRHQLVILDPFNANLTRGDVAAIQRGANPDDPADDVIVLCYASIGEDIRTAGLTDEQMLADPRFVGDGSGPRVDPRGPDASGQSLADLPPLGAPSSGGAGYASFYLDDNDVYRHGVGDGRPDRNANFGGAFVNAGDPAWYDAVRAMQLDSADGVAGLDEILTATAGRGLDCDGVFLDTVDTAAPNVFTDATSPNLSQFEWTAPGFHAFIERLRADYPRKVILQNRGVFFFDPRHHHFAFTTAASIDFVLFESFRLDSDPAHEWHPYFYPDNRHNVAPKLMAEANRGRGFRVLSLGYAEGPPATMDAQTLVGGSSLGYESLLEDIEVAQAETGFRHYLSDASVTLTNSFVLEHTSFADTTAPVWTSTYNDNHHPWPTVPGAPTPRVGIQELVPGPGRLTVRWDVALDLHRVRYVAYVQPQPFDFAADPDLARADRRPLTPRLGAGYRDGVGPDRFPYEADLTGLDAGVMYHVLIRAVDDSPAANEDANQRVLSAAPDPPCPFCRG